MNHHAYTEPQGLTYEEAIAEAQRCLNCVHKPCVQGCVAHNEIPSMIQAFLRGDGEEAKRISESKTSFPEICGRVCYQDIQCEAVCVRMKQNAPVKIGLIERFIGDHYQSISTVPTPMNKRLAILGSGPSGLACAAYAVDHGLDVTVYEKKEILGGVLKYGIPPYRLPNPIVDQRIHELMAKGVTFIPSHEIHTQHAFDQLRTQGYDAIFLAIGASRQNFPQLKGSDHPHVLGWKAFLSILNIGESSFREHFGHIKSLCVIGGGNVAMDVSITAKKFGIDTHLIYRRTEDLMPARKTERHEAHELGVVFHTLRIPLEVKEQGDHLELDCLKTEWVYDEQDPRGKIVTTEDHELISCDSIVVAIGSSVRPLLIKDLELDDQKQIIVDDHYETSIPMVFAAGDGVTGTKTVIHALAAGQLAAQKIVERLK